MANGPVWSGPARPGLDAAQWAAEARPGPAIILACSRLTKTKNTPPAHMRGGGLTKIESVGHKDI